MLSLSDLSSELLWGQAEVLTAHREPLETCGHSSGLRSLEQTPSPPAKSTRCVLWGLGLVVR